MSRSFLAIIQLRVQGKIQISHYNNNELQPTELNNLATSLFIKIKNYFDVLNHFYGLFLGII